MRLRGPAVLLGFVVALTFAASAFLAIRIAVREIAPGQLALLRFATAAAVFGLLATVRRPIVPPARDLAWMAVAGVSGVSLYNWALNTGQQTVSAGVASLLVNTVPIWTGLGAMLFLGERIGPRGWLGTMLSFVGIGLIVWGRGANGVDFSVLFVLLAATVQAVYFLATRSLVGRYSPYDVTAWVIWFGFFFLLPFAFGFVEAVSGASRTSLWLVVYLGVGPGALNYLLWSWLLRNTGAGKATRALYAVPVLAIILEGFVLAEYPPGIVLLGGAIAVGGVALGSVVRHRRPIGTETESTRPAKGAAL